MIESIFQGLRSYRYCKCNDLPLWLFYSWLKEKWKADLTAVLCFLKLSPLMIFWILGVILTVVGKAIIETHEWFPDSWFLGEYRRKQQDIVIKIKEYERKKNAGE